MAGKMFGVLIVRDAAGRVGALRAFAGMLGGRWDVDGFVGPVFDLVERNATWPAAERELRELDAAIEDLSSGARATRRCAAPAEAITQRAHAAAEDGLKARHEAERTGAARPA